MPQQPRVTGKVDAALVDVATGEERVVTGAIDLWPDAPRWIDERRLAYAADEHGVHALHVLDVGSGEDRTLTDSGNATEVVVAPDRQRLYCLLDTATRPADLAVVPLSGGGGRRLTDVNAALLEGVTLTAPTSHVVPGADGREVQLFEFRPRDFDATRRYPLLLWIHGGPLGSFLDQFHFRWNPHVYTERGYVLILVNPRGSTGFGQDFIEDNNGNWGNRCFRDLMAVTDQWQGKPYVDASRTAALGASFGGYMVNWIAGHDHRFRCLVSHAGLFHLPAFWGTTDAGPWWELEFGGTPWTSGIYEEWSPHRFAPEFKTPTLVVHGELDYRVPLVEGLQMFQALQKMRVPSKLLYFPDENHWILKPANMALWNETVLEWLEEWMAPRSP
jgi:dipeptidyl aminopeptidase/acylaminoacyl peptidase